MICLISFVINYKKVNCIDAVLIQLYGVKSSIQLFIALQSTLVLLLLVKEYAMTQFNPLINQVYASSKKWGVITILLGILAIALPMLVGIAITLLLAIVLIIAGIVQILVPISDKGKLLRKTIGYLTLLLGFILLFLPKFGLASLTLFLGAYFWCDALANFCLAWKLTPKHGWMHIALNGIFSLILAFIIMWQWPTSSEFVIGILIGVKLIGLGSMLLLVGKSGQKLSFEQTQKEKVIN